MARIYRDYQEKLLQDLQDPKAALHYLNAAMIDEDERVFLIAIKDVFEAYKIENQ